MINNRKNKKEMKTLESKFKKGMDLSEIINMSGMSRNPGHYSGRGANISDLNSDILERIYTGIKKAYGKSAGEEFVHMVTDIPKMSATDFLINLYTLESNKWNWDKKMLRDENGIYIEGRTEEQQFAQGMATLASVMSGMNTRDESIYIKRRFLEDHGIKSKDKKEEGYLTYP